MTIFGLLHFVLSLLAFLALNAASLASQDSAAGSTAPGWLEPVINYLLLQPLAYWVIQGAAVAWWTWPGLAALVVICGLNSAFLAAALHLLLRRTARVSQ